METYEQTDEPETAVEAGAESMGLRPEDMEVSEKSNLAAFLNEEEQKRIATKCVDRHNNDVASRSERMKRLKELQKLYALVAEQKNFPWHKCANVKTPAITGPQLQIQARLYDMIWPRSGRIFYAIPATTTDMPFATVAEKFANAYVRYKMPYMGQGLDDTIHQMSLYGSAFRRTYWDAYEKKVRSDWIPIEDFVVAATQRSQDPSMSDVPRYTMVHHLTQYDIEDYGREGIFVNTDKVKAHSRGDEMQSDFKEMSRKIDGVTPDDDDEDAPRQVLEQHCKWRLPNKPHLHPAFDGKAHHVIVTIDAASSQLLRMSLREEDDPDDKRRYDREMQKLQQSMAAMQAYQAGMEAYQQQKAMHDQMLALGPSMAAPAGVMMVQPPAPMPPPGPPPMAPEPKPIRKRQICFFTHYRCFPSEGFYGLGYGDVLYGIALAQNTIINQHIDGMTLRNAKPMFMSRQVRMQRGGINIGPGEVNEVDGPANQIRDAIMFLDPPMNDPSTVPLIKMLDGMKDVIAGSGDLMSGQSPGSNQTKAGMEILNEQMMTPITVLGRRVTEAFRHELDKIWRCWGVFLEDEDVADIVNDNNEPEQLPIGRWMFSPTAHLVPASDPRAKSQRSDDHQKLMGFVMNNPFIMQNPQAAPPILRALTEEGFRIMGGDRLIPLLPPIPPQPQGPPPAKPQWAENAGFLRGQDSGVNPDDNDDEHMGDLMGFLQSPAGQMMDKTGRDMAERHMRAHQASKIEKNGRQIEQQKRQLGIGGPPGPGPQGSPPLPSPNGGGPGPMAGPANQPPPGPVPPGGA